jgi:hypothetical protein
LASFDDLIKRLKSASKDLQEMAPQIAFETTSNALAYIETRWITEGKSGTGGAEKYSEKKFSAGLLFRRTEGKGKSGRKDSNFKSSTYDALYKKAKKGEEINYKDIRSIEGLQTSHKDFKVTGQFWKSMQVQQISKNGLSFEFTIDSNSERGKQILKHTAEGKQDIIILDLTQQELNILSLDLRESILEIFNRNLR